MTTSFDWKPERSRDLWRHGAPCLRPFVVLAPWVTVGLLLLLFHFIGGTLVSGKGALVDLPQAGLSDGEVTGPVALIVPVKHDVLVFFDDSRYLLGDAASVAALAEHLADSAERHSHKALLALTDRRISSGDLMRFASLARKSGIPRVLIAEKKGGADE